MENKTYTQKCEEFANKMQDWLWREYIPSFKSNEEIANNSVPFAVANCWVDAITVYADSFQETGEEDDDGWIDIDKWIMFFGTHTLSDCAEELLMFKHLENFDPFGFSGFEPQLECLETVINEMIKQEEK